MKDIPLMPPPHGGYPMLTLAQRINETASRALDKALTQALYEKIHGTGDAEPVGLLGYSDSNRRT